jgi:hypothetical protein
MMKKSIISIFILALIAGCSRAPKDFSGVRTGMTREEVVQVAGEPSKKNNIEIAELWTYTAQDRTVVFRADTVYDIITSASARTDSIRSTLGQAEDKLKSGARKLGKKVDTTFRKLEDRFKRDSN